MCAKRGVVMDGARSSNSAAGGVGGVPSTIEQMGSAGSSNDAAGGAALPHMLHGSSWTSHLSPEGGRRKRKPKYNTLSKPK